MEVVSIIAIIKKVDIPALVNQAFIFTRIREHVVMKMNVRVKMAVAPIHAPIPTGVINALVLLAGSLKVMPLNVVKKKISVQL